MTTPLNSGGGSSLLRLNPQQHATVLSALLLAQAHVPSAADSDLEGPALTKEALAQLAHLLENGELTPTFEQSLSFHVATQPPEHATYAAAAREQRHRDGDTEIDEYDPGFAIVSKGDDDGAYVMAWVWIDSPSGEDSSDPDDVVGRD